jgi:hypothetical protein
MAKMSMDYADLGEELQVGPLRRRALILFYGLDSLQTSRLERAQMQILCEEVVQEFDAATRQVRARARPIVMSSSATTLVTTVNSSILLLNSPPQFSSAVGCHHPLATPRQIQPREPSCRR